jgi:hypothetical protein
MKMVRMSMLLMMIRVSGAVFAQVSARAASGKWSKMFKTGFKNPKIRGFK